MRNPLIIYQPMGNGGVLMDTTSGDCYELNGTGRQVWERLSEGLSLSEIVTEMARLYSVPREVLDGDVAMLVDGLSRHRILIPRTP